MESLATLLQKVRGVKKLAELARRTGVSYSYVVQLANGDKPADAVRPAYRKLLTDTAHDILIEVSEEHPPTTHASI